MNTDHDDTPTSSAGCQPAVPQVANLPASNRTGDLAPPLSALLPAQLSGVASYLRTQEITMARNAGRLMLSHLEQAHRLKAEEQTADALAHLRDALVTLETARSEETR